MCRLLLLINIQNPTHSIQSFLSQSERKTKNTPGVNNTYDYIQHKDGFGFAWMTPTNKWKIYKSPLIYKDDPQLEKKLETTVIQSDIIIGHIRHKTIGNVNIQNTHPFYYQNQVFFHNGKIWNFEKHVRPIRQHIAQKYLSHIKGDTDSEHLFYLFLSYKDDFYSTKKESKETELRELMQSFFDFLENLNIQLLANIIYANQQFVIITRYTIGTKYKSALSLYYDNHINSNTPNKKNNGIIFSSEPITDHYRLVPEQSIIILPI